MKKLKVFIMMFLLLCLVGCATVNEGNEFRFESRSLTLEVGDSRTMKLMIAKQDLKKEVVFNAVSRDSSDPYDVVLLEGTSTTSRELDTIKGSDGQILVTGLKPGNVYITAYFKDNEKVFDTVEVIIKTQELTAMQFISDTKLTLNNTLTYEIKTFPEVDNSITLSTSNPNVLKVENNIITAVGVGTATITATSKYDPSVSCVKSITVEYAAATKVNLETTTVDIIINESYQVAYTISPANANQKGKFSTSSASIATVNSTGLITAKAIGKCTITILSDDNKANASITVNVVYAEDTEVSINDSDIVVQLDKTFTTKAIVTPANANPLVSYEIIDGEGSVSVNCSANGNITFTGEKLGEVTIKFTSASGNEVTITLEVVHTDPASITVEDYSETLGIGKTQTLSATVLPITALQGVIFEVDNEEIATITSGGILTGVSEGEVVVTMYDSTKKISKTITITIVDED